MPDAVGRATFGPYASRTVTALDRLASSASYSLADYGNVSTRHMRSIVGTQLPEATPVDDVAVVDHWVDYYVDRILSKRDTVTIVDGEPGEGKSNFALWLGTKVRQRLSHEIGGPKRLNLEDDVVYRLTTFIHRVYQSSRDEPSVIIADEGVLVGAQAGAGLSDVGRILDRVLSVARIKGCTVFILHPNVWGLASFVRNRRAKVLMHVEYRGLTTAFTLKGTMDFTPPTQLPFKKVRQPWSRLRWPSLENDPIWAHYEPAKLEVTNQTLVDSEMEAARVEKQAGMRPPGPWAMDYWEGDSGKFRCDTCGGAFDNAHNLAAHACKARGGGGAGGGVVTCPRCDRSFDNAHNLAAHRCAASVAA